MKKSKRVLTALLCIALSFCLTAFFVGCDGAPQSSSQENSQIEGDSSLITPEDSSPEDSSSTDEPADQEPELDLDEYNDYVTIEQLLNGDLGQQIKTISGVVTEVVDGENCKFVITDESGSIQIDGMYASTVSVKQYSLDYLGIDVGDTIVVKVDAYIGEGQAVESIQSRLILNASANEEWITVSTAEELTSLISAINSGEVSNKSHIKLGANIDMQGKDFVPITQFRGVFDGGGYKISNIVYPLAGASIVISDGNWVNYSVTAVGFFASAYDITVKNLTLDNVTANFETGTELFLGALVGYSEGIIIENCTINSNFTVAVTHENIGRKSISGVAGVIGYSLGAIAEELTVNSVIDYRANSYEAFAGAVLGVGNVCIYQSNINLDVSFVGDVYGHTGSLVGMERTLEGKGLTITCIYDSVIRGKVYVNNPGGYAWGEVGQGWFFDYFGDKMTVGDYNDINVQTTISKIKAF